MDDNDDQEGQEFRKTVADYKQEAVVEHRARLAWDKELIFAGQTQRGYDIDFDANVAWGCMPVEALMLSLAGCFGIDVMFLLRKMRVEVASFKIDVVGRRNPVPPQYFKQIEMHLSISGDKLSADKLDRVIRLSREKYCSVYNSLRPDTKVDVTYSIGDAASDAGSPGGAR